MPTVSTPAEKSEPRRSRDSINNRRSPSKASIARDTWNRSTRDEGSQNTCGADEHRSGNDRNTKTSSSTVAHSSKDDVRRSASAAFANKDEYGDALSGLSRLRNSSASRPIQSFNSFDRSTTGMLVDSQTARRGELIHEGNVKVSGQISHLNHIIKEQQLRKQQEEEELARRRLLIERALRAGSVKRNTKTGKYEIYDSATGRLILVKLDEELDLRMLTNAKPDIDVVNKLLQKKSVEQIDNWQDDRNPFEGRTKVQGDSESTASKEKPNIGTLLKSSSGASTVSVALADPDEIAEGTVVPSASTPSSDRGSRMANGPTMQLSIGSVQQQASVENLAQEIEHVDPATFDLWGDQARKLMPKLTLSKREYARVISDTKEDDPSGITTSEAVSAVKGLRSYAFVKYDGGQFKPLTIHLSISRSSVMIKRKGRFNKLDPEKFDIVDITEKNLDFLFEDPSDPSNRLSIAYKYHPVVLLVSGDHVKAPNGTPQVKPTNQRDMRSVVFLFQSGETRSIFVKTYEYIAAQMGANAGTSRRVHLRQTSKRLKQAVSEATSVSRASTHDRPRPSRNKSKEVTQGNSPAASNTRKGKSRQD